MKDRVEETNREFKELQDRYFTWLTEPYKSDSFNHVLRILFNMEFYWSIRNDENRAMDGFELRHDFMSNFKDIKYFSDDTISYFLNSKFNVLEVLIALADRIDYIMSTHSTKHWFYLMLDNIGINNIDFSDISFTFNKEDEVRNKIDKWLARDFGNNGEGCIFPGTKTKKKCTTTQNFVPFDYKNTEIWYQLMNYLNENYTFYD